MTTAPPTIFALASGAPPCAIAVIRIAGPSAFATIERLTGRPLPPSRRLARRDLVDPATGDMLDRPLVVAFPGPASATGDDVVELHLHGGAAVVAATLALLDRSGLTPAMPGAFTRRAFDHGKLDLGQVAALGDLIAAETDGQRRAALSRTGGHLAARVDTWRATLLAVRADVEATLDFADDDGVPPGLTAADRAALTRLIADLAAARAAGERGGRLRDGVTVALTGPVNAGKSTLFNALARRDAAMVSPLPGTTRDTIEARIDLGGVPVMLFDTAGQRPTGDPLEAEGIRRGTARAASADIVVHFAGENVSRETIAADDRMICVASKSDLDPRGGGWRGGVLHVSAATGDGLDLLEACLGERVASLTGNDEPSLVAHRWQIAALDRAMTSVDAALAAADVVVVAEDLRRATLALSRLTGRLDADDILDGIFSRFCIGK